MPRHLIRLSIPCLAAATAAAEPVPYEPDEATLHLWHLDEAAPPFADAAAAGLSLHGLLNDARAGIRSADGFGHCLSFHHHIGGSPGLSDLRGAILIPGHRLDSGPDDNAPSRLRYRGEDGAFTFEALVRPEKLPEEAELVALTILSMDGDSSDRIFNFRIERQGFLAFTPLVDSGARGGAIALLPGSGPHAIRTGEWFHVAVTYDGRDGVPDNLQLYWTRLGSGSDRAHPIGGGSLSADLNGRIGDLAIGNEARGFDGNAEAEPFPGLIDEVRISSIARPADGFLLTAPEHRPPPTAGSFSPEQEPPPSELSLAAVSVDGQPLALGPVPGAPLSVDPGLHRLDFDLEFSPAGRQHPVELRCQLAGFDERWQETARGMSLDIAVLDTAGRVLSEQRISAVGSSAGWNNRLEESAFTQRHEPLFLPAGAETLRVTLGSGSPDTTGSFAIDKLRIGPRGAAGSFWKNGDFEQGSTLTSPAGLPEGWSRGGRDPAVAQILVNTGSPGLALVDANQSAAGEWTSRQAIPGSLPRGQTLVVSWHEAYSVIPGSQHRASYRNVPPGQYVFRAVGIPQGTPTGELEISLPLEVRPHPWERPWFWPLMTALGGTALALVVTTTLRRRARRRLRQVQLQHALERDRMRIARDLHDDLGTRVSVLNLSARLAGSEIERRPGHARRHLDRVATTARELVGAMDDLVWAVDPAHDSLDQLASHLIRLAEDLFGDSAVRCRLRIPDELPDWPLASDLRHNLSLAVKEALHNVLRHAGPCEARLTLEFHPPELTIRIEDDGVGFDPDSERLRHGLDNLDQRMREIGGRCQLETSPGNGTRVSFHCRLPDP